MTKQVALVTGANRGIGLEVARQLSARGYTVLLASRDPRKAEQAIQKRAFSGGETHCVSLDVRDRNSIVQLRSMVQEKFGRLDVLVNNAGIFLDAQNDFNGGSALEIETEVLLKTFETNTLGPYLLSQQFLPVMMKNKYGRIVNVSSGMGQLTEMNGSYPGYRISKTALNAVTKIFAEESRDQGDILINSVCPGWVKTDMGGPGAERKVEDGAAGVVWAATLPSGGPTGGFFRDGERIEW